MSLRTLMLKPFLLKPRLLTPLITAALETVLNGVLFNDKSLKAARSRLVGKVLRIELREINFPLLFVFSERLSRQLRQQQHYLAEAITEEWRMAPNLLEVMWFHEEVDATARATEALSSRLATMETK